jgi:hypothetical protein
MGKMHRRSLRAAAFAVLALLSVVTGRGTANLGAQAGQIIDVPAGGNLQQAINQAQPGATIRLAAGATFTGSFILPAKNGSSYIVITTAGTGLPGPGVRTGPGYKPQLATIKSASTSSAIATAPGASYYRIVNVAFEANKNGAGDIIALGGDQTSISQLPHHIWLDRLLIYGDPTLGQKRAIAANAAYVLVENSYVRNIKAVGQDSQAIGAWNTPGPFLIRNNYLEAAGENIMFGGAHIGLSGVVPSDITIEDNLLTKNPAWRGTSWTVKNIFELKAARRVAVRRNIFEYAWGGSQQGYAIVLTPRNQSGQTPWVDVTDVEFSGNLVAHAGSAFNLLGHDDMARSGQLARIVIRDNLIIDIDGPAWAGTGTLLQIGAEPKDITFDHNTVLHTGNIVTFYSGNYINSSGASVSGGPVTGFVFTNNLVRHNAYGIFGTGQAFGNGSLSYYAPGAVVRRNAIASDTAITSRYPADNLFPTLAAFNASFRNVGGQDYQLAASSALVAAGTDGRDIGCDFGIVATVLPPVVPGGLRIAR